MHLSPLAYIYLYTINIGRGEATHGNAEISKQRNMEILFGLFIIVLIVILVKVFRSKPEQTEPVQLSNPAHERNMILLAEVKRQAEEHNDQDTIQAVLNMTYDGPMPEQKPDGSYTSIYVTYLRYNIAGINYRKRVKDYVGKFKGYIQPEPTNQYDPNAIAVYAEDGHHLGYIPEAETYEIRELGIPFPIEFWGEIEECYDYDRQRNFYVGHILIEQPDCARTCAPAGSKKE